MSVFGSLRAALARVTGLFTGRRADADLRAELEAHLEMQTAENIRRGMQPNEARRQAMLSAGGLTQAAESVRDRRGLPWVDGVAADLKYALRALRHSRAFTVIVVLTLALGIGANTAIFSVVRGVLLKPLPNRDGDRLVYLRQSADGPGQGDLDFSVPEVSDLRHGVPSLGGIAEYSPWSVVYQSDEGAVRISVGLITGNYFEIMGLSPVIGRLTRPSDDGPGVPGVAVLTHEYWMRRFHGDPSIVGKQLRFDNKLATVIGVLQPAPFYPRPIDALLNMVMSEHHLSAQMVQGRTHRMTAVVARLAPGATLQQARSEVASVYTRLQGEYKDAYDPASHYKVAVIPFHEVLGERARLTLWLLMGAAAFVLIIAVVSRARLYRGRERSRGSLRPHLQVSLQPFGILDLRHLPRFLHRAIPGKLPLRLRPRLLLGAPPKDRAVSIVRDARNLRRDAQPDPAASHFRQTNRALASIRFVRHASFALANFVYGPLQIAVPFQRVHREIKVSVEDEHKRLDHPIEHQNQHQRHHRNDRLHHRPGLQCLRHGQVEIYFHEPESAVVHM